jgi:ribonucleoside-diphosphate reductase alpha chain
MVNKFSHMRFEPNGFTRNSEIPIAKSLIDYIFRWLASRFLDADDQDAVGIVRREPAASTESLGEPGAAGALAPETRAAGAELKVVAEIAPTANGQSGTQKLTFVVNADAPACSECGSITVRSGACYKCMNCGATTGCS